MFTRGSGILLHISSLPSIGGIGDLGPEAYHFADFLHESGHKYWQILPINPTDPVYGNCPYSSPSAFAVDPLLISPELLLKDGLLKKDEIAALPAPARDTVVDHPVVIESKTKLLEQAFQRFKNSRFENEEFAAFCQEHKGWLEDHALFTVFKKRSAGRIWSDWPEDIRSREPGALKEARAKLPDDLKRVRFLQFIFFKQWAALRAYCQKKGISLIGDIPIYVNEDSADVWANPGLFKLGPDLKPVFVAGVPPDYFSETGQRWGNPVYDWAAIKANAYGWWTDRLRHNFELFDIVRIDHFRGLLGFWEIPAADPTAVNGHWQKGPGEEFLAHLQNVFPKMPIIAEDLGVITPDVTAAMQKFNLPGMKVLHFAFSGDPHHPYLPENYSENSVVYTGTHDNNTTRGWFAKGISEQEKQYLQQYLKEQVTADSAAPLLIRLALGSRAVMAVIPMQDYLNLGEEARMNVPGTVLGNWAWRLGRNDLKPELAKRLLRLNKEGKR